MFNLVHIYFFRNKRANNISKEKNIFEDVTQFELMLLAAGETPNVSG